jgi:hypothetical protein
MKKIKLTSFFLIILFAFSCKKDKKTTTEIVNEFTLGLIPSQPEDLALVPIVDTSYLFNLRIGQLDPVFSLDMPPVRPQGKEGSCVAFSCAYAARSYIFHKAQNISYFNEGTTILNDNVLFSPEFLYNNAKESGSCDSAGMYIVKALEYIKTKGVSTWEAMPYFDDNGCTTLPTASQYQNGELFKIQRFWRFTDISENFIKQMLANRNPIIIGVDVDAGFRDNKAAVWKKK